MKKYYLAALLIMQSGGAMELATLSKIVNSLDETALEKLSHEDEAKALRFAKLFNKYPRGYGESNESKEASKNKMNNLLQQKSSFSLCVIKYQNILKNMEAEEVFQAIYTYNELYNDGENRGFGTDLRHRIIFIDALQDDLNQYYAMSNAVEFSKITGDYVGSSDIDLYKKCFLSEINGGNKHNFSVSAPVYHPAGFYKCSFLDNNGELQRITGTKETCIKLSEFLNEDVKAARLNEFKILMEDYNKDSLNIMSNPKDDKEKFIELLTQLRGRDNKRHINSLKGADWDIYILLPLSEILTIKNDKNDTCDVTFYQELAKSNDQGASLVEFDQGKLQKWQDFSAGRQESLKDIYIKLKNTPRTFIEHILMHSALLISVVTPDVMAYYTGNVATAIGCGTTTTTILSIIASLALNVQIGKRFFPHLYAKFNSHTPLVRDCIKQDKIKKTRPQGLLLFVTNGVHIICSFMGNKFLSFTSLPGKIFGMALHAVRVPFYYYTHKGMCMDDARNDIYKAKDLRVKENL